MKKNFLLKVKAGCTVLVLVLAFFVVNLEPARAGGAVVVVQSIPQILSDAKLTIKEKIAKIFKTYGSQLVGTTVRNTLNRVALDAAKYVASAGEGQKPTYVVEDFGTYWKNVGDAAAGDFIDSLGKAWAVDLCQPPSANIQAKISLGLVQTLAPNAPDCTLSNLVSNYSSAYEKYTAMANGDYLKGLQVSFDPSGSELGGAFTLFGRTIATSTQATADEKAKNTITQGWLDVRNIAGNLKGTPGAAKDTLTTAKNVQAQSLLTTTGDALVDAANTFLNQLAYEGFQRVLRELNKGKSTSSALDISKLSSSGFESLIQYGESMVSEKLASVIKPRFDVHSDYSILSDLATCADQNNPGPTNCVIDDKFSQAISEKLTVGDALTKGYLHGDWLVSNNNKSDSTYTLRSASILRKYRIIPVGWEQAISVATSKGYKVTLQDLISCFDGNGLFSSDFDKNNQTWCRGLVDPNWVLKAPLNSCAKQGAGSQILSSLISQDANGLAVLAVSRATDYCADEQTCIKEKTDGSCEVYGYCNEEKRTWNFNSDSCEPVFNTCQTFTSASNKQTASFLENTLDYSTCDANNSGCKQYSYNGSYLAATSQVIWDKNYSVYFNNKAIACDPSSESCTQLLRGKAGWSDVNYVMDPSFNLNNVTDTGSDLSANWHWPIKGGAGTIIDDNGKALAVTGQNQVSLYSSNDVNLLPKNLNPITGWSYTLSADVKLTSGDRITMTLGDNGDQTQTTSNAWVTISVTASNSNNLNFDVTASAKDANASFSIRNLKLTPNNYYPGFSNYAAFPVYEKLLPTYLENTCYNSTAGTGDYTLKASAPAVCDNFARKCNRNEVGCELFTSVKDTFAVAAKANVSDYCDAKCVGYDTYLAKASYFYGTSADNIIPANTKTCSAESVGCASFTNLDSATQGGESVEYYAKVRQCIKPDTGSCSDFYSWDNSQLKVMSLKKDSSGSPYVVDAASDALCNKNTYNLPVTDPNYNADCREFYNKSGAITYHLISNTVSCSDDCHAYRLNEKSIDKTLTSSSCVGSDKSWDASQSACYVCKNGGTWDTKQGACIYQAVPTEGTTCSAAEVGCREYNGNNGNNLKLVASYGFDDGLNGFVRMENSNSPIELSTESTVKNGKSLSVSGKIGTDVSSFAKKDSAYVIKFMAKAPQGEVSATFALENDKGDKTIFGGKNLTIKGDNQWHVYELNIDKLDHAVANENLSIQVSNFLLIDNIIINEINDRYYLIQGSSQVPDVCFYDMSDKYQGPSYNLGCSQYTDRAGAVNNLHQFSELCQNSAVGCEQMIQTNNSASLYSYNVNLNGTDKKAACVAGTPGCLEVKGNQAIYAVFDSSKQCNKADAGCTRFGSLQTLGATTSWVDTYKKNLPDTYQSDTSSPLCQASEVGCDAWSYGNGSASYFKTPGLNTCIFKNNFWYKSPVQRCDINSDGKITGSETSGALCLSNADCGTKKCVTDTNDYPCAVSYSKTLGLGGANGRVATPDGSVGLCNAESAGCGEYIDPVSKYVNNLIYNPIAQDLDGDNNPDKWTSLNGLYYQRISVKPNKLYILQVDGNVTLPISLGSFSATLTGNGGLVNILGPNNQLGDLVSTVTATSSVMFNTGVNTYVNVYRNTVTTDVTNPAASLSLKEAIINYQLSANIDTATCNGVVNTDNGCVLFNARTQVGRSGLKQNIFNAKDTADGQAPQTCGGNTCSANSVIKVSPDRICSRWLSCQTYTEDPVTHERTCYKMGECDQLNEKNECGNFLALDNTIRDISNSQNKNATGYSLLNDFYLGAMKEVGQNTDAHFDFESSSINLTCRRNVDVAGSSALNDSNVKNTACIFDKSINDSLVLSPNNSPTNYPAHGKGFLKVLNYYQISPLSNNSSISVYTNQDYYINYLVNTKGSSAKAKLLITDETGNNVKASFIDTADNGWERKIYKFNIAGASKTQTKIKIYLTSNTANLTPGYVYFDDINIEPVLQTGTSSYVSKDCRLYPSDDSMSCLSANNNVIKDGLYGYCLQYDPLNPGVCLMWYPVDQIAPITRNSQSVLGYSGKFPLYYCTEANGNFALVDKRLSSLVKTSIAAYDTPCSHLGKSPSKFIDDGSCGNNYVSLYFEYNIPDDDNQHSRCSQNWFCVPKNEVNSYSMQVLKNGVLWNGWGSANLSNTFSGYKLLLPDKQSYIDGDEGGNHEGVNNFKARLITSYDGWYNYNGVYNIKNATPPIRVWDYNSQPADEDGLKLVSSLDPDQAYRLTCNKFAQFVDNEGGNMAWTGRISRSSLFSTTTPNFFGGDAYLNEDSNLYYYGRNREDVPFGAAVLSNDYNWGISNPLALRNQYSKKNGESLFAGRPYGCSGPGCSNIGQCSLDSNVFCFYTGDADLNKQSCSAGGNGVCVALWRTSLVHQTLPSFSDAISNLNQIFVKKYADLGYSVADSGYKAIASAPFSDADSFTTGASHVLTNAGGIIKVLPVIKNEDFRLTASTTKMAINTGNVNIEEAGLYQLSFNSIIDSEQQPMKQIIIDWGDSIQVVTSLDNKPEDGTPHNFYHFYLKGPNRHLEIKVIDNWGAFKCSAMSNNSWGGACKTLN